MHLQDQGDRNQGKKGKETDHFIRTFQLQAKEKNLLKMFQINNLRFKTVHPLPE